MFRLLVLVALIALVRAKSRIIGGVNTTIEDHPYQLALEFFGQQHCGAVLLSAYVGITAAHCTEGFDITYQVIRAGTSTYELGGQTVSVASVCQNPNYLGRPTSWDYDISVLQFAQPLLFGDAVLPIDLQPIGEEVPVGTLGTVTGWGDTTEGGTHPDTLQEVQIPHISHEDCQAAFPKDNITARMDCYEYPPGGRDSCQGDSGGPMVVNNTLVGIVSWGAGCGRPNTPGVFVKISNKEIQDFINQCIEGF